MLIIKSVNSKKYKKIRFKKKQNKNRFTNYKFNQIKKVNFSNKKIKSKYKMKKKNIYFFSFLFDYIKFIFVNICTLFFKKTIKIKHFFFFTRKKFFFFFFF